MLFREYEIFHMEDNDVVNDSDNYFTAIVNGLKALGKNISQEKSLNKILRSLIEKWEAKVSVIYEAKDFPTLKYEELIGSLLTHEMMTSKPKGTEKKKIVALKCTFEENASDITDHMTLFLKKTKNILER